MPSFIRKNALVLTASFKANDGTATQPSSVVAVLTYKNLSGTPQRTDPITLTYDALSNLWSALWDSSVAGRGLVNWVIYGSGTLVACQEGSFEIYANEANNF